MIYKSLHKFFDLSFQPEMKRCSIKLIEEDVCIYVLLLIEVVLLLFT